jgi:hypothetical protein
MSDPIFADHIKKVMNEGVLAYGTQLTPVVQASFPSSQQLPSDNMQVVTNGETAPIDAPRTDVCQQNQGQQPNAETMSEVSSLLVSIGYILSKDGIVPDKFNTSAVLEFLNKHFPAQANVPCDVDTPPQQPSGEITQTIEPVQNPLMESRKILEKRWIVKTNA